MLDWQRTPRTLLGVRYPLAHCVGQKLSLLHENDECSYMKTDEWTRNGDNQYAALRSLAERGGEAAREVENESKCVRFDYQARRQSVIICFYYLAGQCQA